MKARVERRAEQEVIDAACWYESAESGLGTRFLDAFDRILESIDRFPASHMLFETPSEREYRAAIVKPFPLVAVYEIRAGEPVIVAVNHTGRGTRFWHRRITRAYEEE